METWLELWQLPFNHEENAKRITEALNLARMMNQQPWLTMPLNSFLMRKIIPLCKSLFLSLVLFVAILNPNWWGPGTVYFCSAELEIRWCTVSIHFPWHHSLQPWTLGATSPSPQHTYTASSLPGWDPWIHHQLCLPKLLDPHSIYISKSNRSQSSPG